jgi:hypothetical protein
MLTYAYNLSTQEAEAGELQVLDQPGLNRDFSSKPGLHSKTLSPKKKKKKKKKICLGPAPVVYT